MADSPNALPVTPGILDRTYANLPPIGEPDTGGRLAMMAVKLGTEAQMVRTRFLGETFVTIDRSINLYLHGREGGESEEPTLNLMAKAVNTTWSLAIRTPPTMSVTSASINPDGYWVMKANYVLQPPVNPDGSPAGEPMQFTALERLSDDLPPQVLGLIPIEKRYHVCTETVIEYLQQQFDLQRRRSRMNQTIRWVEFYKLLWPLTMGLFEWDDVLDQPRWHILPPHQWLPHGQVEDVQDMVYCRLDYPMDSEQAKRYYPDIAAEIDKAASRSIDQATGSYGYSSVYLNTAYERPMVTAVKTWLRNQPFPMTPEEALDMHLVVRDPPLPAPGSEPPPPVLGEDGQPVPEPEPRYLHPQTGEDITPQIEAGDDGQGLNGRTIYHAHWPRKIVTRYWTTIKGKVVKDVVSPHWDGLPIFLNRHTSYPNRPYSQPMTCSGKTLQRDMNQLHADKLEHLHHYRAPIGFVTAQFMESVSPPIRNATLTPGKFYTITMPAGSNPDMLDINKHITWVKPPDMPAGLPIESQAMRKTWDDVMGHTMTGSGSPPPGVTAASAIAQLQSAGEASASATALYSEECCYRMGMLLLHGIVNFMRDESMFAANRSVPIEIVRGHIRPWAKAMTLDMEVSLANAGGMVKAQHDAQVRADVQARTADGSPLIDVETAREDIGYDNDAIESRLEARRRKAAEQMASQQTQQTAPVAAGAPQ